MTHGFFGYLGNKILFTNIDKFVWIGFAFIFALLIMVFKSKIYEWYHVKDRKKLIITLGIIILGLNILSRIMYWISGYPLHWEIVPLHLCRLAFSLLGIFLVINRIDLIKWIVIPMIFGSFLAIINPSLDSNSEANWNDKYPHVSNGIDNYFYWDYYSTHMTLFTFALILWSANHWTFTIKEIIVWLLFFTLFGLFIFTLNIIINTINPEENADYCYLGKVSTIKLWKILGPFSRWPFFVFTYMFGAWGITFIIYFLWVLQGFADFGKWEFYSKTQNPIVIGSWIHSNYF